MLAAVPVLYSHTWCLAPTTDATGKLIRELLTTSIDSQFVQSPLDPREILLLSGTKSGVGGPFCSRGCRVLSFNLDTLTVKLLKVTKGGDNKTWWLGFGATTFFYDTNRVFCSGGGGGQILQPFDLVASAGGHTLTVADCKCNELSNLQFPMNFSDVHQS